MPKANRRAGHNIRALAIKRRTKAIVSFASAGFVAIFPFLLTGLFNDFLQRLPSARPPSPLSLPPIAYLVFTVLALGLLANGMYLWKRADHADQGAKGEEDVALEMRSLQQNNWTVEYNLRLEGGLGDADIVCISPGNTAFVIDVKSHRGEIVADGDKLSRRMGQKNYPFEKDFLKQVTRQAVQVKKQKKLEFVTPIIAFSNARVSLRKNPFQKVYVVEKTQLVKLLRSLDS